MPAAERSRLSPLDAAFLTLESDHAPMHVGWAALFSAPAEGPRPTFEAIRTHVEGRLGRAPLTDSLISKAAMVGRAAIRRAKASVDSSS